MAGFDQTIFAPWGANTAKEYSTAVGNNMSGAPSQFAGILGGMYDSYNKGYGSYNQGLGNLGNSYAQNYAAMASGMAGLANALGNTWNNAQAANQAASAAAAAQQAAVSNLGTAAITSYGDVAGKGLQAWSQNQNGYQNALSQMTGANQNAISQLGTGRYNALANLGKSGAALGVGQSVASALPGLAGNGGTSTSMPTPTGSYDLLNGLRGDINNGAELSALYGGYDRGLTSLNADQDLARNMPRTMVHDAYGNLMNFNRMNLDASSRGMDQFYDYARQNYASRPGQAIPTGSLLDALAGGYSDSADRIRSVQNNMNSGWGDARTAYGDSVTGVNNLFDRSIGNTGAFRSPYQVQQDDYALQGAALQRARNNTPMMSMEQSRQNALRNASFLQSFNPGRPRA
jgi:hypothetical protein